LSTDLHPVRADKVQIDQVLMNLVVNARDAMPNGGKLVIETANVFLDTAYIDKYGDTQPPGPYVMLSVSDTGQGMDAETKQRIFEPFFTTKERGKGTGLGLATVFGIVKQHQGNIRVYSEPDSGTTLKIYLPRATDISDTMDRTVPEPTSLYGKETVLVAEDEEMVRKLVCETLATYGYHIIEAEDPSDALELAASYRDSIHLLLTDVVMPKMNGRELYQKLVDIHPESQVLYMSGYMDNVVAHRGILDQGIDLLRKPFTTQVLTRKIRSVLNRNAVA
jgi:CheY-like chemotaxis protein